MYTFSNCEIIFTVFHVKQDFYIGLSTSQKGNTMGWNPFWRRIITFIHLPSPFCKWENKGDIFVNVKCEWLPICS